jgi:hypothetical protein
MNIRDFISLALAQQAAEHICKQAGTTIYPVYNDLIEEATQQQIVASGLSLEDLHGVLAQHTEWFINYASACIRSTRGEPPPQEYPPGYGEEEPWEVKEELGVCADFVILHLINFTLLRRDFKEFERYLKAIRVPHAAKEAKRLRAIFDSTA